MHTFKDNADRTWTVAINVAAVKRVRALMQLDLYGLVDDRFQGLADLVRDPVRLADVLYCLCKDEADAQQISDEDFGRALAGDVLTTAADAFVEELIDFFPDPKVRTGLRKVVQTSRQVRDKLLQHAESLLDRIDPEQEARTLIASSGGWPVSSDSIRVPSRSANS